MGALIMQNLWQPIFGCFTCLAVCFAAASNVAAEDPFFRPAKAKVEIRWVEAKKTEGLTEDKGYQTSCDPDSVMYPHKKPALVLDSKTVEEVGLKNQDLSKNGLAANNYMVSIKLTKAAREKLAASVEGKEMRLLTIMVDDRCWGLYRYEIDPEKPFVPEQARAATFAPEVGFFSSKADADRVVSSLE
jgi:hypothetical protein